MNYFYAVNHIWQTKSQEQSSRMTEQGNQPLQKRSPISIPTHSCPILRPTQQVRRWIQNQIEKVPLPLYHRRHKSLCQIHALQMRWHPMVALLVVTYWIRPTHWPEWRNRRMYFNWIIVWSSCGILIYTLAYCQHSHHHRQVLLATQVVMLICSLDYCIVTHWTTWKTTTLYNYRRHAIRWFLKHWLRCNNYWGNISKLLQHPYLWCRIQFCRRRHRSWKPRE